MSMRKERANKALMLMGFILLFIVSFFISIGNGAVKISPLDIMKAVLFQKGYLGLLLLL